MAALRAVIIAPHASLVLSYRWKFLSLDMYRCCTRSDTRIGSAQPSAGGGRAGVTLLEIVIALLIIAVALVPIFRGFKAVGTTVKMTRERTIALFLAQAVLEEARFQLYHRDSRFFKLSDSESDIKQALSAEEWQEFFKKLGHERQSVISAGSLEVSTYFASYEKIKDEAHGFLPETDPQLCNLLKKFECKVTVSFTNPDNEKIDPDGDGKEAHDMAWIVVEIFWKEPTPEREIEKSVRLSSILTEMTYCREAR